MDPLTHYREIIKTLLETFTHNRYANPNILEITNKIVFDSARDRYLVMSEGWETSGRRLHGCLIDLEIINGKVWIQRDGTDYGIAKDLMSAGIPPDQIVLGFKEPAIRPHTGFAVS